jgi:hypothetical protein
MFQAILAFITYLALVAFVRLAAERRWLWRLKRFIDVLVAFFPIFCILFIGLFIQGRSFHHFRHSFSLRSLIWSIFRGIYEHLLLF